MKRNHRCPKCKGEAIGHLSYLPDTLTHETEVGHQFLGVTDEKSGRRRVGVLEAYICTSCGYLETYVQEPGAVPFEKIEGFSWMSGDDDHPYR